MTFLGYRIGRNHRPGTGTGAAYIGTSSESGERPEYLPSCERLEDDLIPLARKGVHEDPLRAAFPPPPSP